MTEQLYRVTFTFFLNDSTSEQFYYDHLTSRQIDELLLKFSMYGEVPPDYKRSYGLFNVRKDFLVSLFKPENVQVMFSIDYSGVSYNTEDILKELNEGLVSFIQENTKVEGFLT